MKRHTIMRILTASVLCASFCTGVVTSNTVSASSAPDTTMRDITTMELVADMGIGINLGNTFESSGDLWWIDASTATPSSYETAWGSPTITQAIIQGYADAGFDTLRIPVAWSNMMDEDYTIDSAYIERVQEVVDWTLDAGMYAIINLHWDGGWVSDFPSNTEEYMKKYKRIWEQVSDAFKDYGDYLLFESQNEELGDWDDLLWNHYNAYDTENKAASYDLVNEINQTFVDVIRASGGNNPERHLIIDGFVTDITRTCDSLFEMPDDPAGRCAVSIHYYDPSDFTLADSTTSWTTARDTWGTDSDFTTLENNVAKMKKNFTNKGIPVIVGEYGMGVTGKDSEYVNLYISSVCQAFYDEGMCPILWDITDMHYSRKNCEMKDTDLQALLLAVKGESIDDYINNNNLLGDVDGDGSITAIDAHKVLVAYASEQVGQDTGLDENQMLLADVDGDGSVTAIDAHHILVYYATAQVRTDGKVDWNEIIPS